MEIDELNRLLGNVDNYLLDQLLKGRFTKDIKISGSVSLEYRDSSYSTNTYGKNLFLLDATLKEAEIRLKAGQDPLKLSGGLKDLAVTDDGVIHSWNLSASVKDMNLFNGFVMSGSLNLAYQRALAGDTTTETYKGVAEISSFNLPMAGLSTDPGSSLSGKLSFVSVDDELQSWTLSARASNLKILDTFELNGEIEISTSLTTNPHNHTVKAAIQGLTINVANKFSAKMAGQLNLSYKTIDGSIYAVEEEWTLKATTLELRIPNTLNSAGGDLFAVKGQAEVYRKKNETDDDFKVTAKVDQFSLMLPGNSNVPAINLSGEISASFDNGDLKTLKINSKVQNLKIKDFSLDGAFELSYQSALLTAYTPGEDVYMVHAEYNQLKLQAPGGLANSLNLGSGSVSLTYGSLSGITAWDLRAKITNLKLFNAVTFSGSSGISYIKKIERIDTHDLEGIYLFSDAHGADFGGHI